MYAKLNEGRLVVAPKMLTIGDNHVWNAPAEQYAAQGWLPVVYTDAPRPPEGYTYESGWAEEDNQIVQTWALVELPDDIDDSEAYNIIFGGDTE